MGFILTLIVVWIGILILDIYTEGDTGALTIFAAVIFCILWGGLYVNKQIKSVNYYYISKYKHLELVDTSFIKYQDNSLVFRWDGDIHEIKKDDIKIEIDKDSTYMELKYMYKIKNIKKNYINLKNEVDSIFYDKPMYILHKKYE